MIMEYNNIDEEYMRGMISRGEINLEDLPDEIKTESLIDEQEDYYFWSVREGKLDISEVPLDFQTLIIKEEFLHKKEQEIKEMQEIDSLIKSLFSSKMNFNEFSNEEIDSLENRSDRII